MSRSRRSEGSAFVLLFSVGIWAVSPIDAFAQSTYTTQPENVIPVKTSDSSEPASKTPESSSPYVQSLGDTGPLSSAAPAAEPSLKTNPSGRQTAAVRGGSRTRDARPAGKPSSPRSSEERTEASAVQALKESETILSELTALEEKWQREGERKAELEKRYKELQETLNGKVTGGIAGLPDELAFYKQTAMTLRMIQGDLRRGAEAGDPAVLKAAAERFYSYRDLGDPGRAAEDLKRRVKNSEERTRALPAMIEDAQALIQARSAERRQKVEAALEIFKEWIELKSRPQFHAEFSEHVWPEYMSHGDVWLPWEKRVWVESQTYKAVIGGQALNLEFRNGEMDPSIEGALQVLQTAGDEYPGRELRLLRLPEVLSAFGGYSLVRNGFAHFISAEPSEFVLYETDYPAPSGNKPRKAAVFSVYDLQPSMMTAADVNQDGRVDRLDADLAVQETVQQNSWGEGGTRKMSDVNGDGAVNRTDALIVEAAALSGAGAAERLQLVAYLEKASKAQEDFLRALPGVWQNVRAVQPAISRDDLERLLAGLDAGEGDYVRDLHRYFTLMKTASEAIETRNPDLVFERHPDFFDASGQLIDPLVHVIENAGLAALPSAAIFENVNTEVPVEELRGFVESMKGILGDDPSAVYDARLEESRQAMASVVESLEAVNDAMRDFADGLRQDQLERAKLLAYVSEAMTAQESMLEKVIENWKSVGTLKAGMSEERLKELEADGTLSAGEHSRAEKLLAYQTMAADAGRTISENGNFAEFFARHPLVFDASAGEIRPDFQAFMEKEGLPGLMAVDVLEGAGREASTETLRDTYLRIHAAAGDRPKAYFAEAEGQQTGYFSHVADVYTRIENFWAGLEAGAEKYSQAAGFIKRLETGSLDFDGDGMLSAQDAESAEETLGLILAGRLKVKAGERDALDVNRDGAFDAGDREAVRQRLEESQRSVQNAGMFAERMRRAPDLTGDGVLDENDAKAAAEGYAAAFRSSGYLPAGVSEILDLNQDGTVSAEDSERLSVRVRTALEDARQGEFRGFEVSASMEENGGPDLGVKVAPDGSAEVQYRQHSARAVFDRSSYSVHFEIPRGASDREPRSRAGRIHFRGSDEAYAIDSFEIRQSFPRGSHVTRFSFSADGRPASRTSEFTSADFYSRSSLEFKNYRTFSSGESRALNVRSFEESRYAAGSSSVEFSEIFEYAEIKGRPYPAASRTRSRQIQTQGEKVLEGVEERKIFTEYSDTGSVMRQVSVVRSARDDESSVSGWAQSADPSAMTRTFVTAQSLGEDTFEKIEGVSGAGILEEAAEVKTVQFYGSSGLSGPVTYSLQSARETTEGRSGWKPRRADRGGQPSWIVTGDQDPLSESHPRIQNGQLVTPNGKAYAAVYGPVYRHDRPGASAESGRPFFPPAYQGYGLVFSELEPENGNDPVSVFAADFPRDRRVTFPGGTVREVNLDEKGGLSLK